ncbi:MAG: phage holin family protein [Streptosporangiaceae bacterium]
MNEPARTASPAADRSVADLVKDLSELIPQLVRDEIKLAQLELTRKGKQAGMGAGMFAGSGLVALYGVGCLIAAVVIAISGAIAAWLAALIVGVALLAVAALAALAGAGRLRRATPPVPEQAMHSVQADIREVREELHDKGAHQPAVQQTAGPPGTGE